MAAELNLTDDVRFLGTRNDPENLYPALDVVALTSLNEGTPLTLIEAMANARPVIATAVGGAAAGAWANPEIFKPAAGFNAGGEGGGGGAAAGAGAAETRIGATAAATAFGASTPSP